MEARLVGPSCLLFADLSRYIVDVSNRKRHESRVIDMAGALRDGCAMGSFRWPLRSGMGQRLSDWLAPK